MLRRRPQGGFTLIELLIVIAVIGIIAAILIPNLLDAMQKAKQKRTMADMKLLGTSMMAWLTDQAGAAAAAGASPMAQIDLSTIPMKTRGEVEDALVPYYIQEIPADDGWHQPFDYYLNLDNPNAELALGVRSRGRDSLASGDVYTAGAFDPTDYDQDLVWVNGGFIRWPQRLHT